MFIDINLSLSCLWATSSWWNKVILKFGYTTDRSVSKVPAVGSTVRHPATLISVSAGCIWWRPALPCVERTPCAGNTATGSRRPAVSCPTGEAGPPSRSTGRSGYTGYRVPAWTGPVEVDRRWEWTGRWSDCGRPDRRRNSELAATRPPARSNCNIRRHGSNVTRPRLALQTYLLIVHHRHKIRWQSCSLFLQNSPFFKVFFSEKLLDLSRIPGFIRDLIVFATLL